MKTYIYPPQSVAVAVPPIEFLKNGVSVNVEQDTVTPANNNALPSLQFIVKDGVQVPVTKSTGTPANTVGIPVEIVASTGTPINITAGDINVQLTDMGLNPDSVKVGNGTGNYLKVNADGSSDVNIKNTSIPVTASSLPLPTGAATEAKQDSSNTKLDTLIAKDFATSAKQDTANTSLATIAGKDFATSAKQDDTNTKLDSLIAKDFATSAKQDTGNTSLSSIDGKLTTLNAKDFSTSAKQDLAKGVLDNILTKLNASLAVTGTFWQATQPVSIASAISTNSTPQTISGTITCTQKTVGTTAVRATVSGSAPSASRKKLLIKPSANNTGNIYIGSSSVTTSNGMQIVGPDRLEFILDASDYYLISDTASQSVDIIEVA